MISNFTTSGGGKRVSAAAFWLVATLGAATQLQHGGVSFAKEAEGHITCNSYGNDLVAWQMIIEGIVESALNDLPGVSGIHIHESYLTVPGDCVASALNDLSGVSGIICERQSFCGWNGCKTRLHVQSDIAGCDATALALSGHISDFVDAAMYKIFFIAAGPVAGATFIGSGFYAYTCLGGDSNLKATAEFALFVAFRVFDLASDWGTYSISLSAQHKDTLLRGACLAFSIIGSILLIVDLRTLRMRARLWFGVSENSDETRKKVGKGMLAIVFLEDLPQMIITIAYLVDVKASGRIIDAVAVTSLIFSAASMLISAHIGLKTLRAVCRGPQQAQSQA